MSQAAATLLPPDNDSSHSKFSQNMLLNNNLNFYRWMGVFALEWPGAICDITLMARGPSSRIVVVLDDPSLKRDLHAALAADDVTLKDWFQQCAANYLTLRTQPTLPGIVSSRPSNDIKPASRHAL